MFTLKKYNHWGTHDENPATYRKIIVRKQFHILHVFKIPIN